MSCRGCKVDQRSRIGHGALTAALLGLAAVLGACEKGTPEGQVVAVVNGEEVTVSELNEEARSRGMVIGDDAAARSALVQEIVDRKLLAQAARGEELDRTPDYLLASRRSNELILAQQLVGKTAGSPQSLTPAQVHAIVAGNPQAFAQRHLVTVEQITTRSPVSGDAANGSIAVLAAELASKGVPFTRSVDSWDTASLEPELAKQLLSAIPRGPLVILNLPGQTVVAQLLARVPRPMSGSESRAVAASWWTNRRAQESAQALVARERAKAEIKLQPAFASAR